MCYLKVDVFMNRKLIHLINNPVMGSNKKSVVGLGEKFHLPVILMHYSSVN